MTKDSVHTLNNQFSIGTDIIKIDRFRDLSSESSFFKRVFTEAELAYCLGYSDPTPHLAATFAGKEAIMKASHTGSITSLHRIEILRTNEGAPYTLYSEDADSDFVISLSHSDEYAVAVALVVPRHPSYNREIFQTLLDKTVVDILPER